MKWVMAHRPMLRAYEAVLLRDGWDSWEAFVGMSVDDMAKMGIVPGHRVIIKQLQLELQQ